MIFERLRCICLWRYINSFLHVLHALGIILVDYSIDNASLTQDVLDLAVKSLAPATRPFHACYAIRMTHAADLSSAIASSGSRTLPALAQQRVTGAHDANNTRWLPNDWLLCHSREKFESFRPLDEWRLVASWMMSRLCG